MTALTGLDATAIAAHLDGLRRRVDGAAARTGRDPGSVLIVAVSKSFDIAHIRAAHQAGQVDFGENRVRELTQKALALGTSGDAVGLRWHFVGRLQRNKVRDVIGVATLIHSVDRIEVARAIAERAGLTSSVQQVLVQVNVSNDPVKGGCHPDEALTLVERVRDLDGIACRGLMTLPAFEVDPRPAFRRLRELRDAALQEWPEVQHLSMGMSQDFEVAVEEGATIVRLGEAVFGSRPGGLGPP